jgi:hypothetical protein
LTQALLEMEEITSAIKEESKKSLNALLSEAVRDAIRESCDESEDDEYEVVDDEKNDAIDAENETDETDAVEDAEEVEGEDVQGDETSDDIDATQEAPEDGESEEDWNEFDKYQVGDNTYDLTGENDYESVVKVYKLLKDEDHVIVKKDGDKIQLKDDSVGTEYVIDLGTEGDEETDTVEVESGEEDFDSVNEGIMYHDEFDPIYQLKKRGWIKSEPDEIAGFEGDEEDYEDEPETLPAEREPSAKDIRDVENWMDAIDDDEEYYDEEPLYESKKFNKFNKKARKPMKESKEVLFEVDLGYTDNYQAKDPIAGLSNNEPSKKGKSWHKGVPTGTQKPWAGETKSKGEPFEKTVNEEEMPEMGMDLEEGSRSTSTQGMRKTTKTPTSEPRRDNAPEGAKKISTAKNGYESVVNENKKLKAENKVLKETLLSLKKNLSEAYVTNVNLGKITKLFLENTTSQAEKVDIVNRFSNEAKTVEQSNTLYESIKRELNKNTNAQMNINESMSKATTINENVYKSNEVLKSIDLMNRMGC